jgi:hypothetical protein
MPSSPYQSPLRLRSSTASGTAYQPYNVSVTELAGKVSFTVTVGATIKFGRVYYAPLCRSGGRAAGRRHEKKKMQTWRFAFFSSSQPISTDMGCASPFEPFMIGFVNGA